MIFFLFKIRAKHRAFTATWMKAWCKRIYRLPQLISMEMNAATAMLKGAKIGAGSILEGLPASHGLMNLFVGENSFIAKNSVFALHDQVHIGNNVVINFGVTILTASHSIGSESWHQYSRAVVIADYAWIAAESIILPGVRIGEGAVVGAGSVVREDVAPYTVVAGNPATTLPKMRNTELNYNPCAFNSVINAWTS